MLTSVNMLVWTGKTLFIAALFIIFVIFFGQPSYLKFKEEKTLISEAKVLYNWKNPPAITILTWKMHQNKGWKNVSSPHNLLGTNCPGLGELNQTVACIDRQTFNLSEVLEEAHSADESGKNISSSKFWSEDFSNFDIGKTFTLNNSFEVGKDSKSLEISLNKSHNYTILFHDPHYFMHTSNPDTVPKVSITLEDSTGMLVYLRATYHVMLDKAGHHCERSVGYSFTACIKTSVSGMAGCRLPWDRWTHASIPLCSTREQMEVFEEEYEKIDTWEQESIIQYTGCYPPCSYTEYTLASQPQRYGDRPGIRVLLSSSKVKKRTEDFIYPLISFVAEFGGSLGLFLGFSFIMIWDAMASKLIAFFSYISKLWT